jgi:hypothetical protein
MRIKGVRWTSRVEGIKDYASIILEVDCAETANRMILEGVVMRYDLKLAERYEQSNRVTQCFNCQKYGHISRACREKQKCGHCGGEHTSAECTCETHANPRRCAGATINHGHTRARQGKRRSKGQPPQSGNAQNSSPYPLRPKGTNSNSSLTSSGRHANRMRPP